MYVVFWLEIPKTYCRWMTRLYLWLMNPSQENVQIPVDRTWIALKNSFNRTLSVPILSYMLHDRIIYSSCLNVLNMWLNILCYIGCFGRLIDFITQHLLLYINVRTIIYLMPYGIELSSDGDYVAYKTITFSCISFMLIEMTSIHCHPCVMFVMKSMSI